MYLCQKFFFYLIIISEIILTVAKNSILVFSNFETLDSLTPIKVNSDFIYSSDNNKKWMKVSELQNWIKKNKSLIGNN